MSEVVVVTEPTPVIGATVGGLTFDSVKGMFARVVENGVCEDEPIVMMRWNEATKALLDEIIPVGGMATYDVRAQGTMLILPPELENAIEVEVLDNAQVHHSGDVTQGWYDLVNPFTYVHPNAAHDNPLVDLFLAPDADNQNILRRQYDYPGLEADALVRVTGAKKYIPITAGDQFVIIQNVWAMKLMCMAIERMENGALDQWKIMKDEAVAVLTAEVKKHQLDPTNVLKRKAAYDEDLNVFPPDTYGYTRALLAHLLPGGLMMGKSELSRCLDMAEMRLMNKGQWVGTLEQFTASVANGKIICPRRIVGIVAAEMHRDCNELDIRSIFHHYHTKGFWPCDTMLRDQGEEKFGESMRRVYELSGASTTAHEMRFVGKLRWEKKKPDQFMTIRNSEALRLMAMAILTEESGKDGSAMEQQAKTKCDEELQEYLCGIRQMLTIVHDVDSYVQEGGIL